MEGVQRDYPEYYNNVIRQMQRCFRWRGDEDLRATVYFVINRDGSVADVDILESSRSIAFDIEAMGAAECAGSRDRLGPLPEDLPFDRLQILFKFDPQSARGSNEGE
jgi:TonB family protein